MPHLRKYHIDLPQDVRVCPNDVNGRRVWIKRPERPRAFWCTFLQKCVSGLMPLPMLRCSASRGGPQALKEEAERLNAFRSSGVHVPLVVGVNDLVLVTQDSGIEFTSYLRTKPPEQIEEMIEKALLALVHLHQKGLAHGRPYLKDLVWDDVSQCIGFLDLEENPLRVMSLCDAQARDILLFLASAAQFFPDDDRTKLARLCRTYLDLMSGASHAQILSRMVRYFSPFYRLVSVIGVKRLGKDVVRIAAAYEALATALFSLGDDPKNQIN